jgi:antitoxin component YwqK of YwqJK toxin-antitoxin module
MATEVAAAVPQAVVVAETEAPDCYICMEAETELMPFLKRTMCACSSKASSTLKVHQLCLELCRDRTGKCAVCKTALSGDWAFDETFERTNRPYDTSRIFTQMQDQAKHGAQYTLKSTSAYAGPVRYLAAKGQYKADKLHGPQFTYEADGSAATESYYADGALHGLFILRNAKGVVELEETYDAGLRHGLRKELYLGIHLTGNYEKGLKQGTHLEGVMKPHHTYSDMVSSRYVKRCTYKADVLDGPYMQYHIDCGEALPTETAVYSNGKLNGLQEKWTLDEEKLERKQTLEAHWLDGKRNGRYATFIEGKPDVETWYYMDKKHGLHRSYFSNGDLYEETTWHLDEMHGRVRKWVMRKDKHTLLFDANYDNGFRHGRFISEKVDYNGPMRTITEDFWSDGTKELRNGIFRVMLGDQEVVYSEYKMGVRHGAYRNTDSGGNPIQRLHFRDGLLDGFCALYNHGVTVASGHFKVGVSVGMHVLFSEDGPLLEEMHYDDKGQLHGTCIFNNTDGSHHQRLNFKHGVLHGRQIQYANGREQRVFNMRDGHVIGRFTLYDERGAIVEQTLFKKDDGAALEDVFGPNTLCYPSERKANGTFEYRYMSVIGDIYICKNAAVGAECSCAECYVPPARKPVDDECHCGFCRTWDAESYQDEQRDYEDEHQDYDDYEDDESRYRRRYSDY